MDSEAQATDFYRHVVDRMGPMAAFAAQRLPDRQRDSYMSTIWHIHEYMENNWPRAQGKTVYAVFECAKKSMVAVPDRKFTLWELLFTFARRDDAVGRALALTHVLELVVSYERFLGVEPGSTDKRLMISGIVDNEIESYFKTA